MTSEYLAYRAAVRNRGTIYHENVDQYTLHICPVAVLIKCLRYLGRIYQRHTINNITGTVTMTKRGGQLSENPELKGNLENKCDKYDPQ